VAGTGSRCACAQATWRYRQHMLPVWRRNARQGARTASRGVTAKTRGVRRNQRYVMMLLLSRSPALLHPPLLFHTEKIPKEICSSRAVSAMPRSREDEGKEMPPSASATPFSRHPYVSFAQRCCRFSTAFPAQTPAAKHDRMPAFLTDTRRHARRARCRIVMLFIAPARFKHVMPLSRRCV